MSKTYTNSGKSIRERLLNLSRAEQYNPQMMISRYMQERLFIGFLSAIIESDLF